MMLRQPILFQQYLAENGQMEKIYDALQQEDPADIVLTFMDILIQTEDMPDFTKGDKSEKKSNIFREMGNHAFQAKDFKYAIKDYNKAILHAPENSESMKLAYSNRSALLFTVEEYSACIADIDTVFSMGCTNQKLAQRLRERKKKSKDNSSMEKALEHFVTSGYTNNFFKLNVRHSQIPCASNDIQVITEAGLPKVIAAKDIPVGTLVAVEPPFVCDLNEDNVNISCYYCHNFKLNLIPCRGCCVALFCDESCMSKCNKEYHEIECAIMPCLLQTTNGPPMRMMVKAALKMRQMSKSWKELITASYDIGVDRMRNASVSDIYDPRSTFSLLSFDSHKHFLFGEKYNVGLVCAIVIKQLGAMPSFLPKYEDERKEAMRALARIMMSLYLSQHKIEIINGVKDVTHREFTSNAYLNSGWFSFAGKLKHSCDSNLLLTGLKNNIALIAITPIKKGAELTISYLGHYYETKHKNRQFRLYCNYNQICCCPVCTQGWSAIKMGKKKVTIQQANAFKTWFSLVEQPVMTDRDRKVFKATCEALAALQNAQNTVEHHDLFRQFRMLMVMCQYSVTRNKIIL